MKYALYKNLKTHARDVPSGVIGQDLWFRNFEVVSCVGKYLQYWKYTSDKPNLPEGYENETEWHAIWKKYLIDDNIEVIFGPNNEHRADIFNGERIIEIQKSRLDIRVAEARTQFYKNLLPNSRVIWIINVVDAWRNIEIGKYDKDKKNVFQIKWKYERHWVVDIARTLDTDVFLEFNTRNDKLLKIWVNKGEIKGSWKKKADFFSEHLNKIAIPSIKNQPELFVSEVIKGES